MKKRNVYKMSTERLVTMAFNALYSGLIQIDALEVNELRKLRDCIRIELVTWQHDDTLHNAWEAIDLLIMNRIEDLI